MEREVKIPLTEFLQNGGKLTKGRELFVKSGSAGVNGLVMVGCHLLKRGKKITTAYGGTFKENELFVACKAQVIYE
jgi:hypothetical protein